MKHTKNRVAALLLALAMVLSLAPMAFAAEEFPDMPAESDPSYAAVKSAVDNDIMTGDNGMLNLEDTILRSTVSKMLVMVFAAKGEADLSVYPDVEDGQWYVDWMSKANQMGIMNGSNGKMEPGREVTLAEVAVMLARALGLPMDETATIDGVAAWAAPAMDALIKAGYIADAAGAHEPMTRVEFAEVIYKVSGGNYVKEGGEYTEDVDGNIIITADGVSLKGITVKGDVIIADGVDAGTINLDGVKIDGRLVVRGGSEVALTNGTTAASTVVAKTSDEVTVSADKTSDAGAITVDAKADKVTVDMPEPNVTVASATEVAVQNAEGGSVTLAASGASVAVESGTLENVTVADGASDVKVDVAKDATIEMVSTNTDITITGEGSVEEKEGSGKVTDAEGKEVAGSDEPVDVPVIPGEGVSSVETAQPTHTHNYTGVQQLNATQHMLICVDHTHNDEDGDSIPDTTGCGATLTVNHTFVAGTEENAGKTVCSACGYVKSETTESEPVVEDADCGKRHVWDEGTGTAATCVAEGVMTYRCTNPVLDENGDPVVDGEGQAVLCSATKDVTTTATGHSYTETTTPATCTGDGERVLTCANCDAETEGHEKTFAIPAIDHTYASAWKSDETGHWHACTTCSTYNTAPGSEPAQTATSYAVHDWNKKDAEGNPVAGALCKACGYSYEVPCEHEWENGECKKCEATHTCGTTAADFNQSTNKCNVCGKAHTCGTTAADFNQSTNKCNVCGKAHTCGTTATDFEDGKCNICGKAHACGTTAADFDQDAHKCNVCGKAHTCGTTATNFEDGKCKICGKDHACADADFTANKATTHTCAVCGKDHACTTYENDGNGQEKCPTCGKDKPNP